MVFHAISDFTIVICNGLTKTRDSAGGIKIETINKTKLDQEE